MQETIFKIRYFERGFSKSQLYFFFQTQSLLRDKVIKNKKGYGTKDQSLFRLQNKFGNIPFSLYIIDQVWWFNVKQFLSYSKSYIFKFMQVNCWNHKLLHFHLSFWMWKVWNGREKIIKIWISREREELFRWKKKHSS